jgi:hypothetical protein
VGPQLACWDWIGCVACSFLSGWVGLAPLPLRDMLGALYFYSCLGIKDTLCAKKKKKKKKKTF